MNLENFNFHLPDQLIALRPKNKRENSRLLVLNGSKRTDTFFKNIERYLMPGDLLVANDTKVLKARLRSNRITGGKVEILLERIIGAYSAVVQLSANSKLKEGEKLYIQGSQSFIKITSKNKNFFKVIFSEPIKEVLDKFGEVPLPPYIKRKADKGDIDKYQTVYADERKAFSIAAPTAGFHFSLELLERLKKKGIKFSKITLEIGAGTFSSIKEKEIENHVMHKEKISLSDKTVKLINETRSQGKRIISIGTTTLRCLESVSKQNNGSLVPFEGETELYIYPGFKFEVVDSLITNFHLPKSTLLLLVSAFAGKENILSAYNYAIEKRYRFFSYGDAMFITKKTHG